MGVAAGESAIVADASQGAIRAIASTPEPARATSADRAFARYFFAFSSVAAASLFFLRLRFDFVGFSLVSVADALVSAEAAAAFSRLRSARFSALSDLAAVSLL